MGRDVIAAISEFMTPSWFSHWLWQPAGIKWQHCVQKHCEQLHMHQFLYSINIVNAPWFRLHFRHHSAHTGSTIHYGSVNIFLPSEHCVSYSTDLAQCLACQYHCLPLPVIGCHWPALAALTALMSTVLTVCLWLLYKCITLVVQAVWVWHILYKGTTA